MMFLKQCREILMLFLRKTHKRDGRAEKDALLRLDTSSRASFSKTKRQQLSTRDLEKIEKLPISDILFGRKHRSEKLLRKPINIFHD